MDSEITALIQAYGVALAALCATHPHPDRLRTALATMAAKDPHPAAIYATTIAVLARAIPSD